MIWFGSIVLSILMNTSNSSLTRKWTISWTVRLWPSKIYCLITWTIWNRGSKNSMTFFLIVSYCRTSWQNWKSRHLRTMNGKIRNYSSVNHVLEDVGSE